MSAITTVSTLWLPRGRPRPKRMGKETEETGDVCDEEEGSVGTGTPVFFKWRKAQTQAQLMEKVLTSQRSYRSSPRVIVLPSG